MRSALCCVATASALLLLLVISGAAARPMDTDTDAADAVPPPPSRVAVFVKGEAGYFCIKIPSLVTLFSGVLLAFGEGRRHNCLDWTDTDLVYKRSTDRGVTWSALHVLYSNSSSHETVWIGNAAPVQDGRTGRLVVPFTRNNAHVLVTHSDDDGLTWSAARNVTGDVTRPSWRWVGTGPPAGLQLSSSGRLLIPSYHSEVPDDDGEFSAAHVMYSDDGGDTWALGGSFSYGAQFPNECQAVEVGGEVYINARGLWTNRIEAWSSDGGLTWPPERVRLIPGLYQPLEGCEGSTVKHPDSNNRLLFYSAPLDRVPWRYNLSLCVSRDNATTWEHVKVLDAPGGSNTTAAYSSLSVLPPDPLRGGGRDLAILYEWANNTDLIFNPDAIRFEIALTADEVHAIAHGTHPGLTPLPVRHRHDDDDAATTAAAAAEQDAVW